MKTTRFGCLYIDLIVYGVFNKQYYLTIIKIDLHILNFRIFEFYNNVICLCAAILAVRIFILKKCNVLFMGEIIICGIFSSLANHFIDGTMMYLEKFNDGAI